MRVACVGGACVGGACGVAMFVASSFFSIVAVP